MQSRIVHAPLSNPHKIIDVGCGTGIVTRQLARTYPTARVHGVDISPVPDTNDPTPPNVNYVLGDIRTLCPAVELPHVKTFEQKSTDYIFQRLLIYGMTHWQRYIQQMARLLRLGGWIEVHDYAAVWYRDGIVISEDWQWLRAMRRGAEILGLDLDIGLNAKQYLENAGFVDVAVTQ